MNKIKSILVIIISLYCSLAYSQDIKFGFQTGIGAYQMGELEYITSSVYKSLPFQAKATSVYPSYYFFKPSVRFAFDRFSIGVQLSKLSTGSKISSKDYTGEYQFYTKVNCLAPSSYIDFGHFRVLNKFKVSGTFEAGVIFSKLELKEYFELYDNVIKNDKYNFKCENYYVEPGLKIEYYLYKFASIEFSSSYSFQFGKNSFETSEGMYIKGEHGGVGPDWTGLRYGLTLLISYPFR